LGGANGASICGGGVLEKKKREEGKFQGKKVHEIIKKTRSLGKAKSGIMR